MTETEKWLCVKERELQVCIARSMRNTMSIQDKTGDVNVSSLNFNS